MTRALSPGALKILRNTAVIGWHVTAENILDVADLLRAGLVRTEDDYDVIKVLVTEAGLRVASRRKLVEWGEDAWGRRELTFGPDEKVTL
jgi:hypothetical protein